MWLLAAAEAVEHGHGGGGAGAWDVLNAVGAILAGVAAVLGGLWMAFGRLFASLRNQVKELKDEQREDREAHRQVVSELASRVSLVEHDIKEPKCLKEREWGGLTETLKAQGLTNERYKDNFLGIFDRLREVERKVKANGN